MLARFCVISVLTVLFHKVSLEVTIKQLVGGSAVLNCSYNGDKNNIQIVSWLYNDEKDVCQFRPFSSSRMMKNNIRAESFPEEYEKGNYSIKLKELEETDEGQYTCYITPADYQENIMLKVESNAHQSIEEENHKTTLGPGIITIIVISAFVLCAVVLFILWRCKMKSRILLV